MVHRCMGKPNCSVYRAGLRDGECRRNCSALQLCLCHVATGHLYCKFLQRIIYPWGKDEDRRNRSLNRSHQCTTLGGWWCLFLRE